MYCLYITRYSGNKLPPFYIGSSSVEKVKRGYNGSVMSKKYKDIYDFEQKNNKHLFKTRILKIFNTREEAFSAERDIQIKYDLINNDKYMNMSIARKNGYFGGSGKNCASYNMVCVYDKDGKRIKITKEEFQSGNYVSIAKGRKLSNEAKEKIRIARAKQAPPFKGIKMSKETKEKLSKINMGKKLSSKTKKKISKVNKKMSTYKDINGNYFRVSKDDIRVLNGELFGIATKHYKITYPDGRKEFTRSISKYLKENNLPNKNKIYSYINNGVISSKKYTILNGMTIKEIEWNENNKNLKNQ